MLADTAAQIGGGEYRQSAESMGLLSGPLPDIIAAYQTGIDPFSGREIANPGDTTAMKAAAWASYAYGIAAPGFLTDKGALGKVRDAYTGKVDPRSGEPGLTKSQAWMRLFGVSFYPVDPEVSRARNLRSMRYEIDETRRRLGEKLRDKNLQPEERDQVRKVYQKEIDRRIEALREYMEESEIPEHLRREVPEDRDLIGTIGPIIDGKRKPEAIRALQENGYPALAALLAEMPNTARPVVADALRAELGA
jgi:hypothetical protein